MNFPGATLVGLFLVLAVAAVMTYRKLFREFPFFFAYLVAVIVSEMTRFLVFRHGIPMLYFYTYWITEALEVLLGFLVLYEVFLLRLFPGFNITPILRYLFPISIAVVAGLTLLMFVTAPSGGPTRLAVLVGEFTLALSFCQVAVLAFFCALMLFMSREWRRHELGIAAGFGIYGSVKLFTTVQRAQQHYGSAAIHQLPTVAYAVATLIWLFYLSRSDPEPETQNSPSLRSSRQVGAGFSPYRIMICGKGDLPVRTLVKLFVTLLLLTGTMVCDGTTPIPYCPTPNCTPSILQAGR
jgi:hypothetical protein